MKTTDSDQTEDTSVKQTEIVNPVPIKFLLDENLLYPDLLRIAQKYYEHSLTVADINMLNTDDSLIIDYAFKNGFTVITRNKKDFKNDYIKAPHPGVVYFTGKYAKGPKLLIYLRRTIEEIQKRNLTGLANLVISTSFDEVRIIHSP